MRWLTDLSLISGALPPIISGVGIVGGLWLLIGRPTWFRYRAIPLAVLGAVIGTGALWYFIERIWRPLPDPIPPTVYLWAGTGLCALLLLLPRILAAARPWTAALPSILAAVVVIVTCAVQVNLFFAAYPTLGTAIGADHLTRIDFAAVPPLTSAPVTGLPLDTVWSPPPHMPRDGEVTSTHIPGTRSGFAARRADIYLPPAYFTDPRPLFPVLILLAGQPGQPKDWFTGGRLPTTMNTFAHGHDGLAPVVVVADATGSTWGNPLCVDSPLGDVATYLTRDLPAWITTHLQTNPDPAAWAIGGLSLGGTCALQMATKYPDIYPTFLDLSGDPEPTLGDHQHTLDTAFAGDQHAFDESNPMTLLSHHRYPNSAGVFLVGDRDHDLQPRIRAAYDAATAAGMDVQYIEVPGAHNFGVWSRGLATELNWLTHRLGLTS